MSNNYISNIKDNNSYILSDKLELKNIIGKNYKILKNILTYIHDYCPCCKCIN